jgi:hypothetical protein
VLVPDADNAIANDRGACDHRAPHRIPAVGGIDLKRDALPERVVLELHRIVAAHAARRALLVGLGIRVTEAVRPDHRRLELAARDVPHLPGVVGHELLVQRRTDRRREVLRELAVAQLRQLAFNQFQLLVAMLPDLGANAIRVGHLVDVLVMHRVAVLAAVGLHVGEEPAIDVQQLALGERHDRVVDRIRFASRPEPDVRTELVRMVAVVQVRARPPTRLCFSMTVTS